MNAPASPGLSYLSAEEPGDFPARAVLGQMLSNKSLQQILDTICDDLSFRLPLLGGRIASFEFGCEYLLRRHAGLVQGRAPVGPDSIFA